MDHLFQLMLISLGCLLNVLIVAFISMMIRALQKKPVTVKVWIAKQKEEPVGARIFKKDDGLMVQISKIKEKECFDLDIVKEKASSPVIKLLTCFFVKSGSINRFVILDSVEKREEVEMFDNDSVKLIEEEFIGGMKKARAVSIGVVELTRSLKPKKKGSIDKRKISKSNQVCLCQGVILPPSVHEITFLEC